MAITETRWTEGNYQLAIISLEKPDHGWGPFAMWEVDYLFVKIVQDHLGLQKVWSDPIRCVVWMARPTPVLPVLRWWFNGRYTLQWWVIDWLIRHNLISREPATVWQWRDLKSFSLMPSTRRARKKYPWLEVTFGGNGPSLGPSAGPPVGPNISLTFPGAIDEEIRRCAALGCPGCKSIVESMKVSDG